MDVTFRDPRNTITGRMVAVDGPVSEAIRYQAKDLPPIAVFLRGMIDSGSMRSITVKTTAQDFHRQVNDRAVTPVISEVKIKDGKLLLTGTALLASNGRYKASLGYQESVLLQMLRGVATPGVSLTYAVPGVEKRGPFAMDRASFSVGTYKTKIKTSYENGRFRFDIRVKSIVNLTENLFEFDLMQDHKELGDKLGEQMKLQIEKMLKKIQKHKIDPVGFGLYARAFEYSRFKAVQDEWEEEISRAEFNVSVQLRVGAMGQVK